MGVREVETW
jgi:hypothetical protein